MPRKSISFRGFFMCEFRNITRFLILIIIIFEENIKSKKNLNYFPEIFINLKYEKILKIL